MVVYRSREFLYQNRVAAAAVALSVVVTVGSLVVTGVWAEAPGVGIVIVVLVLALLAVPLTIRVEDGGTSVADSDAIIHVSLAGVMRRSIPLADVSRVQRRDYRPVRDFGGWGWRHAWKRPAVAYAMRGSSAVVLTMRNRSEIYLGVSDEQGLVDALKTRIYH